MQVTHFSQTRKSGARRTFAEKDYYRRWSTQSMLTWIDFFQQPLPTFNIKGRKSVASWPGGMCSFAIILLLLIYGAVKVVQLLSRTNPHVSSYTEKNFYDSSEKIDMKAKDIKFAFGIEGFLDQELKDDPVYVKPLVRMWGRREGEEYEKMIPYHRCSKDDFDDFAPPAPGLEGMLERMKKGGDSGKSGLYCIDWGELWNRDLQIFSVTNDDNY